MKTYEPDIRFERDEDSGRILAVSFRFRPGMVDETREFADGNVLADYDADGVLLSVEVLGPCQVQILTDKVARRESEEVREFLKNSLPPQMAKGA